MTFFLALEGNSRLSTRRWLISGEGLPQQVREGAAVIGSIFERYLQEEVDVKQPTRYRRLKEFGF